MRKLKLQMNISLDGYVATPGGKLDWMTWTKPEDWTLTNDVIGPVNELIDSCDTILMGRKMSREFIDHWENIVDNEPNSHEFAFAHKMVDTPKSIFSKTVSEIKGRNVTVENGDLVTVINALKQQQGKDLMVYGGAHFAASVLENGLVDELFLFVNPTAIGEGLPIFTGRQAYKTVSSKLCKNGVIFNKYVPVKS